VGERTRRIGLNEAVFREVNERLESLNETFAALTGTMSIICECGKSVCSERFDIDRRDYEDLRRNSHLFAVVPGHVIPDVEHVIEHRAGYDIVRKDAGEAARVAEQTDPRSPA
jgi:hypothetical protein